MRPEHEEERNRGPPVEVVSEVSLEERLREKPTLDMDLMQFLVIAGFTYDWEPLYAEKHRELFRAVKERYDDRRKQLPHRIKVVETTSSRRLQCLYESGDGGRYSRTRIIRDLKNLIDEDHGRIRMPNFGVVTFAYLNSALRHFGVEAIKIYVPQRQVMAVSSLTPYSSHP